MRRSSTVRGTCHHHAVVLVAPDGTSPRAELGTSRIFFRHVVMPDDDRQLAQACLAHTVSLLQRTLPEVTWRVRPLTTPPLAACHGSRHCSAAGGPRVRGPAVLGAASRRAYRGCAGRVRAGERHAGPSARTALRCAAQHRRGGRLDRVPRRRVRVARADGVCASLRCQLRTTVLSEHKTPQVDAILTHVVDEASRLSTARPPEQRHATQYGRIAQVRRNSRRCDASAAHAQACPPCRRDRCALAVRAAAGWASSPTRSVLAWCMASSAGRCVALASTARRQTAQRRRTPFIDVMLHGAHGRRSTRLVKHGLAWSSHTWLLPKRRARKYACTVIRVHWRLTSAWRATRNSWRSRSALTMAGTRWART